MHVESIFFINFFTAITMVASVRIVRRIKMNKVFKRSIQTTIGEAATACKGSPSANSIVRVHIMGGEATGQAVGLEFLTESLLGYRTSSMTMSRAEATKLVSLLESAVQSKQEILTAK